MTHLRRAVNVAFSGGAALWVAECIAEHGVTRILDALWMLVRTPS
jgi:hypothetical protein